ncbi:MAG: signal peptide peptidase SppA [Thermodesulfobacteriota bacterium]
MFSRRHPYLFFILIFSAISAAFIIAVSLLFLMGSQDSEFAGLDRGGDKVGVIEIAGVISDAKQVILQLKKFRKEDSIKAIVVRIDSPGGSVGPSQEIFREIRKTIESKKVIASMGAVAASGGYYIAAATNGVVASPGSITGSIGVIMGYANFEQILKKIGLVPVVIKSGEYKDTGSPAREMTGSEQKLLQDFVNKIHGQFVKDVALGRKMDETEVAKLADGRIFTGEEAQKLGLVDRLGNLEDSIEWAGRLGGIKGDVTAVYVREKKFSILKYLAESTLQGIFDSAISPHLTGGYLYRPGN